MVACDVPRPDWPQPGGMTALEIEQAQKDVDNKLTYLWQELINASYDARARAEWSLTAAPAAT